ELEVGVHSFPAYRMPALVIDRGRVQTVVENSYDGRIELLSQRLHLLEPRAVRIIPTRIVHLSAGTEDFSRVGDRVNEHIFYIVLRHQFAYGRLAYVQFNRRHRSRHSGGVIANVHFATRVYFLPRLGLGLIVKALWNTTVAGFRNFGTTSWAHIDDFFLRLRDVQAHFVA